MIIKNTQLDDKKIIESRRLEQLRAKEKKANIQRKLATVKTKNTLEEVKKFV